MEHEKETAPKCKQCRHSGEDDPKRMFVLSKDENNNGRPVVIVECPTLKCGNGWFFEASCDKVDFDKT